MFRGRAEGRLAQLPISHSSPSTGFTKRRADFQHPSDEQCPVRTRQCERDTAGKGPPQTECRFLSSAALWSLGIMGLGSSRIPSSSHQHRVATGTNIVYAHACRSRGRSQCRYGRSRIVTSLRIRRAATLVEELP